MKKLLLLLLILIACTPNSIDVIPDHGHSLPIMTPQPTYTPYPTYTVQPTPEPLPTYPPIIRIVTQTPSPTLEQEGGCDPADKPHNWRGAWYILVPGEEVSTQVVFNGNCNYVTSTFYNAYGWKYDLYGVVDEKNPNILWCSITREKYKQGEPTGVISTWNCVLKFKSDDVQFRWQGSIVKKSTKTFAFCGGMYTNVLPAVCKYVP